MCYEDDRALEQAVQRLQNLLPRKYSKATAPADLLLGTVLERAGWTQWSPEVPSNFYYSVILRCDPKFTQLCCEAVNEPAAYPSLAYLHGAIR